MACEWIQLKKGLRKKILQKGSEGKRPRFWSQVKGKVIRFPLGSDRENPMLLSEENVIETFSLFRIGFAHDEWTRIFELCIELMQEGEVSLFSVETRDGEWIGFQFYLDGIVFQAPLVLSWDISEVIEVSKQLKEQAVSLYREKKIMDSFYVFGRALKLLIPFEVRLTQLARNPEIKDEKKIELKKEITTLVASAFNNLAACQLAAVHYKHVVYLCDQVLERTPTDLKAIYRKASALMGLKQSHDSFDVVKIGLALDPINKAMLALERKVIICCNEEEKKFAEGIKRFFH